MNPTIFSLDGRIVPEAEAVLPVTDRAFLYGDGLFETIHAYGRLPFLLREHLVRLAGGLKALHFDPAPDTRAIARWVRAAVRAGDFPEANVRVTVSRGRGPRGPSLFGCTRPRVVIMVTRYRPRPARDYRRGVAAVVASFRRQETGVLASQKTLNYLEQILARREADAAGVEEALLLNNAGLLCECSSSNVSLVRDGTLCAPDPKLCGALFGTAQALVLRLARKVDIPVRLGAFGLHDLRGCDEAFLTSSMREVLPLVRVGDTVIGNGRPGPVTQRLLGEYRRAVRQGGVVRE